MNKEQLQAKIKEKYGSMSKFAKLAKLDRYNLQKLFARKVVTPEDLAIISSLVEDTENKPTKGEITPAQIKALSKALKQAGGVIQFVKRNKRFSEVSLYQILDGRRKRITPMVKKLFDHFQLT
jgi:hypothetical protein